MRNLYQTLGVEEDATPEQIKSAYKKLSMQVHPDRGGDHDEFQEIKYAYEVLSNPEKRKEYDETGQVSGEPETKEQVAMRLLGGLLTGALKKFIETGKDTKQFDLIGELKAENGKNIVVQKGLIKEAEKYIRQNEEMEARLSGSGLGYEIVLDNLKGSIARLNEGLQKMERRIEELELIDRYLSDCEYDYEKGQVQFTRPWDATTFGGYLDLMS